MVVSLKQDQEKAKMNKIWDQNEIDALVMPVFNTVAVKLSTYSKNTIGLLYSAIWYNLSIYYLYKRNYLNFPSCCVPISIV